MRFGRRGIVVVTMAVATLGCSGSKATRSSVDPTSPVATHAVNKPTDALDQASDDRSLLSFLPAALDHVGGSFEVQSFAVENRHPTPHVRGSFWTTSGGNVYTAVNVRRAIVDRELASLLARPGRRDLKPGADELLSLDGTYYRGNEFQYGFGALVEELGIGAVTTDGALSPSAACRDALTSGPVMAEAANRLTPHFVTDGDGETWRVPIGDLLASTKSARDKVIRACGTTDDGGFVPKWTLRLHRRADQLRVLFDPGNSTEPTEQEVLRITVSDLGHPPSPPANPKPANAFTPANGFILKVAECGTLPWEFSDFAAGNTYTPPNDPEYIGPSVFSTDFLCAPQVPADKR
jgi:hypothetical protein